MRVGPSITEIVSLIPRIETIGDYTVKLSEWKLYNNTLIATYHVFHENEEAKHRQTQTQKVNEGGE